MFRRFWKRLKTADKLSAISLVISLLTAAGGLFTYYQDKVRTQNSMILRAAIDTSLEADLVTQSKLSISITNVGNHDGLVVRIIRQYRVKTTGPSDTEYPVDKSVLENVLLKAGELRHFELDLDELGTVSGINLGKEVTLALEIVSIDSQGVAHDVSIDVATGSRQKRAPFPKIMVNSGPFELFRGRQQATFQPNKEPTCARLRA